MGRRYDALNDTQKRKLLNSLHTAPRRETMPLTKILTRGGTWGTTIRPLTVQEQRQHAQLADRGVQTKRLRRMKVTLPDTGRFGREEV